MRNRTISIVQISGFLLKKDDKVIFEELEEMLPCHSTWDELVEPFEMPPVCEGENWHYALRRQTHDGVMKEDAIGLEFSSVGDWAHGYSFFAEEVSNVGIAETVGDFREAIAEVIRKEFSSWVPHLVGGPSTPPHSLSILTLWSGYSSQSYEGEWDFEFGYDGVIDTSKIQILESK